MSLLEKALCLSHTAVKFSSSLLKWQGFFISTTFTNKSGMGVKDFTFAPVDDVSLKSSAFKITE